MILSPHESRMLDAVTDEKAVPANIVASFRDEKPALALTHHLGCYYRDTIVSPKPGALDRLVKVLGSSKPMIAAARARYAEIDDRVTKRCIISKVHREALGKALEQIGATQ